MAKTHRPRPPLNIERRYYASSGALPWLHVGFARLACFAPSVLKDHRTHAITRNESDATAKKEQERLIHVRRLGLPQTDGWQDAKSHPATPRTLPASEAVPANLS